MATIAQVIPLAKRLPAHMGVFDYSVPEAMEPSLAIGEIVEIPFRKSTRLGLVCGRENKETTNELRPILKRVSRSPLLFPYELALLANLASHYGVSPAVIAHLMLPPLQKRKMAGLTTQPTTVEPPTHETPLFIRTPSPKTTIDLITQEAAETNTHILVLFPEIFRLEHAITLLPLDLQKKVIRWHSGVSPKEEFHAWATVRNATEPLLIFATRGGVFLPIPPHTHVIIMDEGHEEHKHWDQNPRFHVKDVIRERQKLTALQTTLCAPVPSLETYLGIYTKTIRYTESVSKQDRLFSAPTLPELDIIDMNEERKAKRFGTLADKTKDAITESTGDIFIFVHRRGFMGTVGCTACQTIIRCHTCQNPLVLHDREQMLLCHYCHTTKPIPSTCPTCMSGTMRYSNIGTTFIEQGVRSLIPEESTKLLYRIDGDQLPVLTEEDKERIIIGTEKAIPFLRRDKTTTILLVDLDSILYVPEFSMNEMIWLFLHDLKALCQNAKILVQTNHPEHIIFSAIREPDRFYRTELSARKTLGYPPYTNLVRLLLSGPDKNQVEEKANQAGGAIKDWLTKHRPSGILQGPFEMHPHFYRQKFWYTLLIRLPEEHSSEDIPQITELLPVGWRVDVRPNSILKF